MPKVIPEIREQFIAAARQRILYSQQHDLTIREISEDCRTGLGTVYNYFPSKDELIAEVLFEDWQTLWEEVQKKLEDSESPMQDIELIYDALCTFMRKYYPTMEIYTSIAKSVGDVRSYHPAMIEQISGVISHTLRRYALSVEPYTDIVLAEILLGIAIHKSEQFEQICPIICRILGVERSSAGDGRTQGKAH